MDLCQSLLNIKHTHCVLCFLSEERTRPGLPQFPLRSWSWQLLPSVPACRVPGCFATYPCVSQRSKAALSTQVSPLSKATHASAVPAPQFCPPASSFPAVCCASLHTGLPDLACLRCSVSPGSPALFLAGLLPLTGADCIPWLVQAEALRL